MKISTYIPSFIILLTLSLTTSAHAQGGQQCGINADADVVIMVDRTLSATISQMSLQKAAAKTLLGYFSGAELDNPRVGIGTFNDMWPFPLPAARIEPNGSLTDVYGHDSPGATGLYRTINNILPFGFGKTNLAAAIMVAQAELAANAQSANRYIVIISD